MLGIFRKKSDLYNAFLKNGEIMATNEGYTSYAFDYNGKRVVLKKTNRKATKRIIVTCSGHTVSAVRLYPVSHHTVASEEEFNIDVADMQDKDIIPIVVISGKPGLIKGLDEGIFVSANNSANRKGHVLVMSEIRFKGFDFRG